MMNDYSLYKFTWLYRHAPHLEQKLDEAEIRQIMKAGGFALRNTYGFDCQQPTEFWYVIKDRFEGMDELSSKTRNQVRRAFKSYEYRMIDSQFLLEHGYDVYKRACEAYAVFSFPPSMNEFKAQIMSATEQDEFWGAFHKESGKLVAFAINHIADNTCGYSTLKAYPEDSKNYVYYGLLFTMNEYYLGTKGMLYVCDGARSATSHSNIQPFLIDKFNFRKAYCHMTMTYTWWLRIVVALLLPFYSIMPIPKVKAFLALHRMQNT